MTAICAKFSAAELYQKGLESRAQSRFLDALVYFEQAVRKAPEQVAYADAESELRSRIAAFGNPFKKWKLPNPKSDHFFAECCCECCCEGICEIGCEAICDGLG